MSETKFLIHSSNDNVGVATTDIGAGELVKGLYMDSQKTFELKAEEDIPLGHKIALEDANIGDTIIKYGHDIGKVVMPIKKGQHVHIHNL
ncbi:MAG: UxaA family hydrolase, partial [Conexivisphaerales archaeon]